jgi:hypothetical protein
MEHKEHTEEYDTQRFDDESPARRTMRFKQPDEEHEEYKASQLCDESDRQASSSVAQQQQTQPSSSSSSSVQQEQVGKFKQYAPQAASTFKQPESPYQSRDMKDYARRVLEMRQQQQEAAEQVCTPPCCVQVIIMY